MSECWLGMKVEMNKHMLPGVMALTRNREIVWIGRVGSPPEDAICDGMILSREDYERILARISTKEHT